MIKKTRKVKCDRCGVKYKRYYEEHRNLGVPRIEGISERCVERGWEVCPVCLAAFIKFMDIRFVQ